MEKIENSFFANYNCVVALVQSTKNLFNKNMLMKIPLRSVKVAYTALRQLAEICFGSSFSYRHPLWLNKSIKYTKETSALAKKLALNGISDNIHLLDTDGNYLTYDLLMNKFGISKCNKNFILFIKLITKLPESWDDKDNNRISQTPQNQLIYEELKTTSNQKSKSNLHYTRRITPKRVTSCGAHLRGLAPGLHSSEETSQRWRVVGNTVPI